MNRAVEAIYEASIAFVNAGFRQPTSIEVERRVFLELLLEAKRTRALGIFPVPAPGAKMHRVYASRSTYSESESMYDVVDIDQGIVEGGLVVATHGGAVRVVMNLEDRLLMHAEILQNQKR